jgi:hypothetical protein
MIQPSALFYARGVDRYLMILIPTAFLLYATSHPVNRLRVEMPAQFVDAPANSSAARWGVEAEIAQAYWNMAVTVTQWQYGFGSSLPADPPANFRIDEKLFGAAPESRARYWRKLREMWSSPACWRTTREWNSAWVTRQASKVLDALPDYVKKLAEGA